MPILIRTVKKRIYFSSLLPFPLGQHLCYLKSIVYHYFLDIEIYLLVPKGHLCPFLQDITSNYPDHLSNKNNEWGNFIAIMFSSRFNDT
jgi:hypothetical protein